MIGFEGTTLTAQVRDLLPGFPVGGVIFFSRNYSGKEQIRKLCAGLQEWNARMHPGSPPLFLGVDQEGGRVRRFGPPFSVAPPNRAWGKIDDPQKTEQGAMAVGGELRDAGININFAPVLDVDVNPDNPVIGDRSYGSDPALVARHGKAAIRGYRKAGVFPVGKHFPGHGRTSLDSHISLPHVNISMEQLKEVELVPFAGAIQEGLGMIMSAHVVYKGIDPAYPATFSSRILTGLLRQEMGYDGLVLTDDMEMGAVTGSYDFPEACLMAVEAGADILLICHNQEKQETACRAVYDAVKQGRIAEKRIDQSLERVMAQKKSLP